ncbi:MAG TPA: hypothetical protein VMT52_15435, partial [Planctomycetota bacterium]|nr:hypothetical protein [Planctomycetota bacterium]
AAEGRSMDMKKVSRTVGLIVVAVGVFLGWKLYSKSQASEETKKAAQSFIMNVPDYGADKAYYDSLLEFAHATAFDASYSTSGRRRAAKFDEGQYYDRLLTGMIEKAQMDNRMEAIGALSMLLERHRQRGPGL